MSKKPRFLLFFAVILLIFACDLQIPSALVVKGSPDVRFSSQLDMGKRFVEMIGIFNDTDEYNYIDCINTEVITYIVLNRKIFKENKIYPRNPIDDAIIKDPYSPEEFLVGTDGSGTLMLLDGKQVNPGDEDGESSEFVIKKTELSKDFPEGFEFTEMPSKLFVYSTNNDLADVLSFDLDYNQDGDEDETLHNYGKNIPSGLVIKKPYLGRSIPEGGHDLILTFDDDDEIRIDLLRIFIKEDNTVNKSWFNEVEVYVELMVWVPFDLRAVGIKEKNEDGTDKLDVNGDPIIIGDAQIELKGLFTQGSDLFGRGSPGDESPVGKIIESLYFSMNMNKNPFKDAYVAVESISSISGFMLELPPSPIIDKSLSFAISEDKMHEINQPEHFPYSPKVYIRVKKDGIFSMPRDFILTDIGFTANINYRRDF